MLKFQVRKSMSKRESMELQVGRSTIKGGEFIFRISEFSTCLTRKFDYTCLRCYVRVQSQTQVYGLKDE